MADAHTTFPAITGGTDVYLILGDPVEQVRAPQSFNRLFAHFGIDAVLVPARVAPVDLAGFARHAFRASNIRGMWVTIPHKTAMLDLLDDCSALARAAGAVNVVRRLPDGRLDGGLFDGEGFVAALAAFGIAHAGRRVLLLGAGGAAAAIGASLLLGTGGPVAELALYDPLHDRAQALAGRLGAIGRAPVHALAHNDPAGFDLVVNASPLGLEAGDAMPCDAGRLAPHAALVDILMKNQPTPLVRAARARGLAAHPGYEMLVQQTPMFLDFFGFAQAAEAVRQDASLARGSMPAS